MGVKGQTQTLIREFFDKRHLLFLYIFLTAVELRPEIDLLKRIKERDSKFQLI